jgi:hypothetical protein
MLALQAREIFDEKLFLTEHHTHILATIHERDILVIQERKKKDSLGSAVDLTYFQHGLVPQSRIVRQQAIALMKSAHPPIPIHLNKAVTHYCGLVPAGIDVAGRSMRVATKVASDVVLLE